MAIKLNLLSNPGFTHQNFSKLTSAGLLAESLSPNSTEQNQKFQNVEIQNGYGTATTVSVSPGYGATVTAEIDIEVTTVSEEVFDQIVDEVKNSSSYQNNRDFRETVDKSSYSSAASASSGFFGWLIGRGSTNYSNSTSNLTTQINDYQSGDASNDTTVANSVANIMVKNTSKVRVTANVSVTGQLLTPSPTIIAVESTVFSFTDEKGNSSSVSMLNQSPLVAVDSKSGTVSDNSLEPGSKLALTSL
ncbi:hypothetical protein [Shewanella sp. 10N.286.54.B9]|uniref:hypothetical protein n=1 Tax=Shewanella sp. 10N.286.54.B9 TaxID=3229719 RepID=UPI00354E5DD8